MRKCKEISIYCAATIILWILSTPFIKMRIFALAVSVLTAYPLVLSVKKHLDARKLSSAREELRSLIEYIYGSVCSGKTISAAITSSLKESSILFGARSRVVKAVEAFSRSGNVGVPFSERLRLMSDHFVCPESVIIFDMIASAEIIGTDITTILKQELNLLTDMITSSKTISSESSQKKGEALIMSAMPFFIAWNLHLAFPEYFDAVRNDLMGQLCFTVIFITSVLTLSICVYMTGRISTAYIPAKCRRLKPPLAKISDTVQNSGTAPAILIRSFMKSLPDKIPSSFRLSMLKDLACVYPGRTDHITDYLIVKLVVILISIILLTVFLISGTNIFVWMFIFVLLLISHDLEIRRRSEEIRRIRAIEFPGFLGLLETLIVCGSSVPSALNKCSVIFSGNKSLLADELSMLVSGILSGKPVEYALEQFAAKLNISEISSALLLVARYHSSGNIDTLSLLGLHKSSCYDFARSAARKHADSVSLKLLLPMMLQFVNVALISVLPSLISSGII